MNLKDFQTACIQFVKEMDEDNEMPKESTEELIKKIERAVDANETFATLCYERDIIDEDLAIEILLRIVVKE